MSLIVQVNSSSAPAGAPAGALGAPGPGATAAQQPNNAVPNQPQQPTVVVQATGTAGQPAQQPQAQQEQQQTQQQQPPQNHHWFHVQLLENQQQFNPRKIMIATMKNPMFHFSQWANNKIQKSSSNLPPFHQVLIVLLHL